MEKETNVIDGIQQQYPDTCAIKSQQIILNEFGIPVTEDQCVQYAHEHGWYNGGGTSPEDVGKILADAGIPCTQSEANVYDLVGELAQGHKVIVGVDSGELWDKGILEWLEDFFMGSVPDHALIVAGIDVSDPNNPMVIVTDPGTGDSNKMYPLDQFMDAWSDSNCYMVSTDVATPSVTESFVQNGMTDGHIDTVAGVDYNTFTQFQDYSHQIDMPMQGPQLYDMFQNFPTMNMPFNDALTYYNMPPFDPSLSLPPVNYVDPFMFDYSGLNNMGWMDPMVFTPDPVEELVPDPVQTEIKQHSIEVLEENIATAHEHAQQCMEDGMYISAQIWQNEAMDAQHAINDLMTD